MSDMCEECIYNSNDNPVFNCSKDYNTCCYLVGRRWIIREHKKEKK